MMEQCEESERSQYEKTIADYERLKAIANTCVFYCIAYYYGFKSEFKNADNGKVYMYDKFYSDKDFQTNVIEGFRDLFLTGTIETIKDLAINSPNLNTWVRDRKSTKAFIEKVTGRLQMEMSLERQYNDYISNYKQDI